MKLIEDYSAILFYEVVEELNKTNFANTTINSLVRTNTHGKRIAELTKAEFVSQLPQLSQFRFVLRKMVELLSPQEFRDWALFLAKHIINYEKLIQHFELLFDYAVAKGIISKNVYINLQQIDKAELVKLLPAVLRFHIESQPLTFWQEALNLLKEALNAPSNMIPLESIPFEEAANMFVFDTIKFLQELATDPHARSVLQSILRPENKAVVEDRKAINGWGGDRNKAFQILDSRLKVKLKAMLNDKRWRIPGARYKGHDSWERPVNDEFQILQIGEFNALNWAGKQNLIDLLLKGARGELKSIFIKTCANELLGEIRRVNRWLGIQVPNAWSPEGKTEDEIRRQVNDDLCALAGREVLDYEVKSEEGVTTSILQQASDEKAFKQWLEDERNAPTIAEPLEELIKEAKLTPRLQIVAKLYGEPDDKIASALQQAFGKKVKPGAVRALKHDLLQKLRKVASKKVTKLINQAHI